MQAFYFVFTMAYAKCVYHGKCTFHFCICHGSRKCISHGKYKKKNVYLPCWVHRKKVVFTMVHAMLSSDVGPVVMQQLYVQLPCLVAGTLP